MKTNVGSFLSFDEFQSLNVTGRIYLDLNTFCFPHFVICYFDQNLHSKLDKKKFGQLKSFNNRENMECWYWNKNKMSVETWWPGFLLFVFLHYILCFIISLWWSVICQIVGNINNIKLLPSYNCQSLTLSSKMNKIILPKDKDHY